MCSQVIMWNQKIKHSVADFGDIHVWMTQLLFAYSKHVITKLFLCAFRSDIDTLQFQMTFEIPRIQVKAQYRSSGVLILVKASGAGDYWGEYGK